MTVIVGYHTPTHAYMAADTLTSGHGHVFRTDCDVKILQCGPGILGAAGEAKACILAMHVLSEAMDGMSTITATRLQSLLIMAQLPTDNIELAYVQPGRALYVAGGAVLGVRGRRVAAGSGGPYAQAWMEGRGDDSPTTLRDAARYAIRVLPGECGGRVTILGVAREE